jgi:hypothetical protein
LQKAKAYTQDKTHAESKQLKSKWGKVDLTVIRLNDEHAVVGAGLGEAVREKLGEDGALPATTSLRHAVDRLDHLHHGVRRVHVLVTGRRVAPYDLVLE